MQNKFYSNKFKWAEIPVIPLVIIALAFSLKAEAKDGLNKTSLTIRVGTAEKLGLISTTLSKGEVKWKSSAPEIAEVFQNGFVVGLKPGEARVQALRGDASDAVECIVTVKDDQSALLDPATLRQYPDERKFMIGDRRCYGSELNGQRNSDPEEKKFTRSNRVINPKPLRADKPLDWELLPGTEVFDGAGMLMGTVPANLEIGNRRVPVSMFNFGASKVLNGRICVYAFSVSITPTPTVARLIDPADAKRTVSTSAWLPLDKVVDRATLLERIGLGKAKLPGLPLETQGYRITGGDPRMYSSATGELSIVRDVGSGPVPSHYLRRPSGTINLIYSVPGFGLGGQGVDSFLVSDDLEFYPAVGAKVFKQPTYFPSKNTQAGQISPQTMTFIYGAIKTHGSEPIYGWIAKEALASNPQ